MRKSLANLKKVFVISKNKAINTKASVACNWAGAMMQKLHANVWTEAVILPGVGGGPGVTGALRVPKFIYTSIMC